MQPDKNERVAQQVEELCGAIESTIYNPTPASCQVMRVRNDMHVTLAPGYDGGADEQRSRQNQHVRFSVYWDWCLFVLDTTIQLGASRHTHTHTKHSSQKTHTHTQAQ